MALCSRFAFSPSTSLFSLWRLSIRRNEFIKKGNSLKQAPVRPGGFSKSNLGELSSFRHYTLNVSRIPLALIARHYLSPSTSLEACYVETRSSYQRQSRIKKKFPKCCSLFLFFLKAERNSSASTFCRR